MRKARLLFVPLFLLMFAAVDSVAAETATATISTNYYSNVTWQVFQKLPQVQQRIDMQKIDFALLDAAVFHETNRRRQEQRLPAFIFHPVVRKLAQVQTRTMAEKGFVGHENPEPGKSTMTERAKLVGLRYSFVAENVASTFGREYKSGESYYTREVKGEKIYSYQVNGPQIPMHTYLSFAAALVESWMNSPGHRKNILHPTPKYLGCACEPAKATDSMFTFYCTPEFSRSPVELIPSMFSDRANAELQTEPARFKMALSSRWFRL